MILDGLIGDNKGFQRESFIINITCNITVKHRNLGVGSLLQVHSLLHWNQSLLLIRSDSQQT
jgi:hypothetical protein